MIENSYVNNIRSTEVSLDIDFNPYRNARTQNSAIRGLEKAPSMTTELMLDCDVDRVTQYFQKQSKES